jgi:hypothetical protein
LIHKIPEKRVVGLNENNSDLSLNTLPHFEEQTINVKHLEANQSFNWLTGTKMNVYAHEKLTYCKQGPTLRESVLNKKVIIAQQPIEPI